MDFEEDQNLSSAVKNGIDRAVGALAGPLIWIFIIFSVFTEIRDRFNLRSCVETRTVALVGGCNWWGTCGVRFSDGSSGHSHLPSAGQPVCTSRKWFAEKERVVPIPEIVLATEN